MSANKVIAESVNRLHSKLSESFGADKPAEEAVHTNPAADSRSVGTGLRTGLRVTHNHWDRATGALVGSHTVSHPAGLFVWAREESGQKWRTPAQMLADWYEPTDKLDVHGVQVMIQAVGYFGNANVLVRDGGRDVEVVVDQAVDRG